jgi:hypothetical protein
LKRNGCGLGGSSLRSQWVQGRYKNGKAGTDGLSGGDPLHVNVRETPGKRCKCA